MDGLSLIKLWIKWGQVSYLFMFMGQPYKAYFECQGYISQVQHHSNFTVRKNSIKAIYVL